MPIPCRSPLAQLLLPSLLLSLAGAALAQASGKAKGDAAPPVLPSTLEYRSSLGSYKAYAEQPVESWRDANDRVGRIGGWRAYAKEIQSGEPAKESAAPAAAPAAPAAPSASPPDPHAGHHGGAKR